jgi:flagellar basal-body rod modification protein FlgD
MASIDSILPGTTTTPTAAAASKKTAQSSAQIQENQFLQLLVAQLQSQNPLDPMDGTQFVSQLAQFSSLQEMTGMHSDLDNIQKYLQPASTDAASGGTSTAATNPFQTT